MSGAVRRRWAAPAVVLAAFASACGAPRVHSYAVALQARADDVAPLGGVRVLVEGKAIGVTDADGRLATEISGTEGQNVALDVACPEGFRDPPRDVLKLTGFRSVGNEPARLVVSATCRPRRRHVAIVVDADGKASLPVLVDGVHRADTDEAGVSHLVVDGEPGSLLRVGLDTSTRPDLLPRNPVRQFQLGDRDQVVLVSEHFTARVVRRPSDPVRPAAVPYRIR
ncbi:MAG TPA: hypothetical protein VH142_00600 [Polyangiaceae bacterium]|jgi:hypothetical protein|nr:hypothetical protein [Polyangiaceae bacterium]